MVAADLGALKRTAIFVASQFGGDLIRQAQALPAPHRDRFGQINAASEETARQAFSQFGDAILKVFDSLEERQKRVAASADMSRKEVEKLVLAYLKLPLIILAQDRAYLMKPSNKPSISHTAK